ncbi:MAG: SPFH domain-containing protein [Thermoplasmata archaeon]|nr:SPFH domain-containing protein [Thermoplasmata archaeon]MCI4341072.1 SPFH domain-containing protein [Thermoplasmata archaeon]
MPDPVQFLGIAAVVVVGWLLILLRMAHRIPHGHVGFVYLFGALRTVLPSGLNFVHPFAKVRLVQAGTGANAVLGLVGIADVELGPNHPPGSVRVGQLTVLARSAVPVGKGTRVSVIVDDWPGEVRVIVSDSSPQ